MALIGASPCGAVAEREAFVVAVFFKRPHALYSRFQQDYSTDQQAWCDTFILNSLAVKMELSNS